MGAILKSLRNRRCSAKWHCYSIWTGRFLLQEAFCRGGCKKVFGVKAIAEDIQIGVSPFYAKSDTEIAEAIINALKWHTAVQDEKVKIKVDDGKVTLQGEVDWDFQRTNARKAIEGLTGVKSITNLITVKPKVTAAGVQRKIESAFQRAASINSRKIKVDVAGAR